MRNSRTSTPPRNGVFMSSDGPRHLLITVTLKNQHFLVGNYSYFAGRTSQRNLRLNHPSNI